MDPIKFELSDLPTLVYFSAPWCVPCKTFGPRVDVIQESFAGHINVVKINADEQPDMANEMGVRGLPFLAIVSGNSIVATRAGALTQADLSAWVEDQLRALENLIN